MISFGVFHTFKYLQIVKFIFHTFPNLHGNPVKTTLHHGIIVNGIFKSKLVWCNIWPRWDSAWPVVVKLKWSRWLLMVSYSVSCSIPPRLCCSRGRCSGLGSAGLWANRQMHSQLVVYFQKQLQHNCDENLHYTICEKTHFKMSKFQLHIFIFFFKWCVKFSF